MYNPRERYVNPICIIGAVLGALACFVRPDYNLPLYMFIYIMRKNPMVCDGIERIKILLLMFITWVVDLVWLLYWAPFYRSDKMRDWEYGIHMFTIVVVILELIFKIFATGFMVYVDKDTLAHSQKRLYPRNQPRS